MKERIPMTTKLKIKKVNGEILIVNMKSKATSVTTANI